MKKYTVKKMVGWMAVTLVSAALLAGCGREGGSPETDGAGQNRLAGTEGTAAASETEADAAETERGTGAQAEEDSGMKAGTGTDAGTEAGTGTDAVNGTGTGMLEVRFGDDGEPFMMLLEDNETAEAVARYVGTSDWRLPIYERDGEADYAVMQYYDIPGRYEIPSNPEAVTAEKAGDVYYSDPNRIVLFYQDAEIPGEYTRIGTFEATEDFVNAVEDNPALEGWGNKIVLISQP